MGSGRRGPCGRPCPPPSAGEGDECCHHMHAVPDPELIESCCHHLLLLIPLQYLCLRQPHPGGGGARAGGEPARRHLLLRVLQHLLLFLTFPHAGGYGFSQRWPSLRTVNPAIVRHRFPRCLLPGCWLSAIPIPPGWALSLTLCLRVQQQFSPAGWQIRREGPRLESMRTVVARPLSGQHLPSSPPHQTHAFWRQLPPLAPFSS